MRGWFCWEANLKPLIPLRWFLAVGLAGSIGLSVSAGSPRPPARTAFSIEGTPKEIIVARLWNDVGFFYPFQDGVTRPEFEAAYFQALNKSVGSKEPLPNLLAEALEPLKDTSTMVLQAGEGRGGHFLPLIWSVDEKGVWLVGGTKSVLTKKFGPIVSIDGEPMADFAARHIGKHYDADRLASCLCRASRREAAFKWALKSASGEELRIESVQELPKAEDVYLEGGWKGMSVLSLGESKGDGKAQVPPPTQIDLHASHWITEGKEDRFVDALEDFRPELAPQPIFCASVRNQGLGDIYPVPDGYAYQSSIQAVFWPDDFCPPLSPKNDRKKVTLVVPQGGVIPEAVINRLTGFGIQPKHHLAMRTCRYRVAPGLDVLMRVSSLVEKVDYTSRTMPWGLNAKIVTREAAKALAAATVINFDHLVGITPASDQERLFRRALEAYSRASSCYDYFLRAEFISRDPHGLLSRSLFDPEAREVLNQAPVFPLILLTKASGEFYSIDTYKYQDGKPFPIMPGAQILTVNGIPWNEVHKRLDGYIIPFDPKFPENFRLNLRLGLLFPDEKSVVVEYKNIGSTVEKIEVPLSKKTRPVLNRPGVVPKGWTLINQTKGTRLQDIVKRLSSGENLIIDGRIGGRIFKNGNGPEELPLELGREYILCPSRPVAWGEGFKPGSEPRTFIYKEQPPLKPIKVSGKCVVLTSSTDQSKDENDFMHLKEVFGDRCWFVGCSTAGTSGYVASVTVPAGDGTNNTMHYIMTGELMTTHGGFVVNYGGLDPDYRITSEMVLKRAVGGSLDPMMDCVSEIIEHLPEHANPKPKFFERGGFTWKDWD